MTDAACPLLDRFRAVLDRHADRSALVGADGVISYAELWELAVSWRDRLLRMGLPPRSPVTTLSGGSSAIVPAFLGVRAAGLVPLLVDTPIPRARREEMADCAGSAAVLDTASGSVLRRDGASARSLPAGAGYIAFSSGSQGPPKGIIGNAAGVAAFVEWEQGLLGLGATIRGALLTSPSFDVVLRDMLVPILSGGTLCVPGPTVRTDPASVIPWLERNSVNVVHLVPTLSARWVTAAGSARLPDLEWSLFAGEPLYSRHVERWRSVAPMTRVVNLYGPSETTLAKFWHVVEEPVSPGLQPVGRGLPDTRLLADDLEPIEAKDGSFRITLETPDGSLGYLPTGVREEDARALTRRQGVTRFVTQDRGRLGPDGLLFVEGRLDGLVKRNGAMVDLVHITELALADPDVSQAYCFQVDPDSSGSIVLAVEGTAGFSLPRLTGRLRRALGPAMPNAVVPFDPLPTLPNGKVDRQGVRHAIGQRMVQRVGQA